MHPDVEELKPKLKEILYDCAVNIRATKAALYLYDGTSRFELVTEYGFRGGNRTGCGLYRRSAEVDRLAPMRQCAMDRPRSAWGSAAGEESIKFRAIGTDKWLFDREREGLRGLADRIRRLDAR